MHRCYSAWTPKASHVLLIDELSPREQCALFSVPFTDLSKPLGLSACVCACCMCSYGVCGPVWRPAVTVGSHLFGYIGWPRSSRDPPVFPQPPALDSSAGIPGSPRFSGGLGILTCLHAHHSRHFTHETVCSLFLGLLSQGSCTNSPSRVCLQISDQHTLCDCLTRKGNRWKTGLTFRRKVLSSLGFQCEGPC